ADDAGLGFAPVAAGDRFAVGDQVQAQAVAREQCGGVVEGDVAQAQDVGRAVHPGVVPAGRRGATRSGGGRGASVGQRHRDVEHVVVAVPHQVHLHRVDVDADVLA